jgi:osmotically-inducible protein OsmY
MNPRDSMTRQVRAALEREPRINVHRFPLGIDAADGTVTLEGEVADVAAKKMALELAAAVPGVRGVVDRVRVAPGEPRGDGAIRDSLARLLMAQPELRNCTLRLRSNNGTGIRTTVLRRADADGVGEIDISVSEGVIVLEGRVISQPHRMFAGALAWWTPGRRDVLNALEVVPDYEERDDEVTEALRLVLEADPALDAAQVQPRCERWVVTLEGSVPSEEQRKRAELDAWAVSGVDNVINHLKLAR